MTNTQYAIWRIKNSVMGAAGYRPAGLPFASEERGYGEMALSLGNLKYKKKPRYGKVTLDLNAPNKEYIDNSSGQEIDQGKIGACVWATGCAIVQDEVMRRNKNKPEYGNFQIDWKAAWYHGKVLGLCDDKNGSYLENFLWFVQEHGVMGSDGKRYFAKNIEKISPDNVDIYLRNRYQVMTGEEVLSPMVDKNLFLRFGSGGSGHCFRIAGKKSSLDYILETTWKDAFWKKESQFFTRKEDLPKLFSMYVIEI